MIKVSLQKTILHTAQTFSLNDEILIADLVEQYLGDVSDHACVVVNGNLIDPSEYGKSVLESGDHVSLTCVPQDFGLTTWLLIASLTASAYAGYAMSRIEAPDGESEQEKKDRIDGLRNGPKKYEPVPVVLGKYRVAPDWLAEPYVENVGDNQYYNLILSGGYAPQKLEDFRIGDTPLREYEDVRVWYTGEYGGDSTQSGITRFASSENSNLYRRWPNDVSQENVAVELAYDNVVTRTSAADVSEIRLDFSYPSGLIKLGSQEKYRYDARSFLRVDVTDTATNVRSRIGKVVPFNSNSTRRYTANTGDVYRDTVTGTYHLAFFGIGGNGAVDSNNGQFNPRGQDIIGLNEFSYRYTTEIPSSQITFYDRSNRFVGVNTDWSNFAQGHLFCTVVRQTLDEFFESFKIDIGTQSTYDVSVSVRRAPTIDEEKFLDTVRWDYITSVRPLTQNDFLNLIGGQKPPISINGTLRKTFYPVVVIVRIRASNQLSGMLDKFNYLATSVVPSDWNTDWRNWKARSLKETENPAELYRWFCQGPMNANPLSNDQLHLSSIDNWRTVCVNEGFKTGGFLNESSTLITELNKIGYTGRGEFSFVDGKYGVSVQEPKSLPVQVFTPKNSWDFSSSRQFPEDTDGLKFEFTNAQADYEQDEGYYNDPTKNPVDARGLYDSVDIPYVTDSEIITKHARFEFFKKVLQREAYTLTTDVEGLRCTRGDLVLIQNDVIDVGLGSGRIISRDVPSGRFTIDETIELVTGQTYAVQVRTIQGVSSTVSLEYLGEGEFQSTSGFVTNIDEEDLVVYGAAGTETLRCVVKEIDYDNDNNVTLTLANYSEDLFDIDEEDPPEYQSNLTPRLSYKRPARPVITTPSNPADFAGGRAVIKIKSSQAQESNVRWYSLEARSAVVAQDSQDSQLSSQWQVIDIVQAEKGRVEVDLGLDNYWEFRARSLSENDLYSGYSQVATLTVPTGPSEDLTSLSLQELVNTPKSPTASLSTIVVRVGLPSDPNFGYGRVQYRVQGQFTYVDAGRVGALYGDRVDIVVPSDGTTYEVVVSSVSITGVESASELSELIRVYDVENDDISPEIRVPNVKGLEISEQGNDTEFVGRDVKFNWRQTSFNEWFPIGMEPKRGVDYGDLDEYFRDYEIKVFDASDNLLSRHFREDNTFTYTYEQNRQDYFKQNGEEGANRSFRVEVRMRGHNNQFSVKPAKLTVSNPEPNLPAINSFAGFTAIHFDYAAPQDRDFIGIKMWMSESSGFSPDDELNLVHDVGEDRSIVVGGLAQDTVHYFIYQAFDAFGPGEISGELSLKTKAGLELEGLSGWAYEIDPVDREFIETNLEGEAIPSEKIVNVTAAKITTGTLNATETITAEGLIRAVDDANEPDLQVGIGPANIDASTYLMWAYNDFYGLIFGVDEFGNAVFSGQVTADTFFTGDINSSYVEFDGNDLIIAVDRIGSGVSPGGLGSVSLGSQSSAGNYAVSVGQNTIAHVNSISFGWNAIASGGTALSVGIQTNATAFGSAAVGPFAQAYGERSMAYGYLAEAESDDSISIGYESLTTHAYAISVGTHSSVTAIDGVALGRAAETSGYEGVSVGRRARANNFCSGAFGSFATASHDWSYAIGTDTSTTASNQIRLGTGSHTTSIPGNLEVSGYIEQTSDETLKTNWRNLPENFVEKVANVKSGVYDRTDKKMTQAGVSAQSWKEVLPQAVGETPDGLLSLDYGASALVTVIELAKEVQKLKAEIAELKGEK